MSDIKWCCEINASGEKAEMVGAVCFQKKRANNSFTFVVMDIQW